MAVATSTALLIGAAVSGVGMIMQQQQASKAAKQQESAAAEARANALKAEQKADRDFNRANQKKPNAGAMAAANQQAALAGGASTMLTGAQGVDPTALPLGKNTLLGQ